MREWIMRGLTGRGAGTAESCDSTEEEQKADLGLICISNSPDFQPAMPETCWFALYSSPLSLLSLYLSISSPYLTFSPFSWFTAVFFFYSLFYISPADYFYLCVSSSLFFFLPIYLYYCNILLPIFSFPSPYMVLSFKMAEELTLNLVFFKTSVALI